ncbi:MAG: hypothetical protein ACR2M1_07060, partial [Gemmatimonadaceae bacterium]
MVRGELREARASRMVRSWRLPSRLLLTLALAACASTNTGRSASSPAASTSAATSAATSGAAMGPFDVVILNGRVVDGTGNPWYYADVAIRGDRIAAVAPPHSLDA